MRERDNLNASLEQSINKLNPFELEQKRQEIFSLYFKLAGRTSITSNQPIENIIKEDFARVLLPKQLRDRDQERTYCLETPYGTLTYDADTLTAISPFLPNGKSEIFLPIESITLETFLREPTRIFRYWELQSIVDNALGREPLPKDNTIKWHVSNIRRKLGITRGSAKYDYPLLKTFNRIGYVLLPESNSEPTPEG